MLGITYDAAGALRELAEREQAEGVRLHAGTRRFARDGAPSIQVEVAPWPGAEDIVLEVAGARLYLDGETLKTLDDKVLDADLTGAEPRFAVFRQAEPAPV